MRPNRIVPIIRGRETRSTTASEYGSTHSSTTICSLRRTPECLPSAAGRSRWVWRYIFPFAVARLGWNVIAVDADPRAATSLERAIGRVATGGGAVTCLLCDARSIALATESVDCVYCISVLEHIPEFESVISEIRRVLRPGGLLVLTFDIDLRGNWELGPTSVWKAYGGVGKLVLSSMPRKSNPPGPRADDRDHVYQIPRRSILDPLRQSLHFAYNKLRRRESQSHRLLAEYLRCLPAKTRLGKSVLSSPCPIPRQSRQSRQPPKGRPERSHRQ